MSSALVQDGPPSSNSSNKSTHEMIDENDNSVLELNSLLESAHSKQGITTGKKKKSTAKDGKEDNTASWRLDTARRLSSVSTNNCLYGLRVVLLYLDSDI